MAILVSKFVLEVTRQMFLGSSVLRHNEPAFQSIPVLKVEDIDILNSVIFKGITGMHITSDTAANIRVDYQCIGLGGMSLCYVHFPSEISMHCEAGSTAFLFCMPLFGHIRVQSRHGEYVCRADQQCALLSGSTPVTVGQESGARMTCLANVKSRLTHTGASIPCVP